MKLHVEPLDDRGVWDCFWEKNAPGALFQSWEWGEVVKNQSLSLVRYGLYEDSRLIGIFQIMIVRARRATYLHIRHGPILERHTLANWKQVLAYLQTIARQEGAWFLRFSPQIDDTPGQRQALHCIGSPAKHNSRSRRRTLHAPPARANGRCVTFRYAQINTL